MFTRRNKVLLFSLFLAFVALCFSSVRAQADTATTWRYKGVSVGMTMDEVRNKLGQPKEKADTQDFFQFSEAESVQVFYGPTKAVSAMTVTFTGKIDNAPTPKIVFGEDAPPKPDGGIFKMVRYPKAGFWISYNKMAGDEPLVIIAVQKI